MLLLILGGLDEGGNFDETKFSPFWEHGKLSKSGPPHVKESKTLGAVPFEFPGWTKTHFGGGLKRTHEGDAPGPKCKNVVTIRNRKGGARVSRRKGSRPRGHRGAQSDPPHPDF